MKRLSVSLQLRLKPTAASDVFPALEVSDTVQKFATWLSKRAYSGIEVESTGSFLAPFGGIEWRLEDNEDGEQSISPEAG